MTTLTVRRTCPPLSWGVRRKPTRIITALFGKRVLLRASRRDIFALTRTRCSNGEAQAKAPSCDRCGTRWWCAQTSSRVPQDHCALPTVRPKGGTRRTEGGTTGIEAGIRTAQCPCPGPLLHAPSASNRCSAPCQRRRSGRWRPWVLPGTCRVISSIPSHHRAGGISATAVSERSRMPSRHLEQPMTFSTTMTVGRENRARKMKVVVGGRRISRSLPVPSWSTASIGANYPELFEERVERRIEDGGPTFTGIFSPMQVVTDGNDIDSTERSVRTWVR